MGLRFHLRGTTAAVLIATAAAAGAADTPHVQARLVSDSAALEPGSTVRVGVLFKMEPGWHVYWKNPGDSGLATEVRFEPPAGFEAGPLEWPIPESFVQPGELLAYGYAGELLLATELRVPARLGDGSHTVSARVSWLACKNECVLGSADLEQRLPVPPDAVAATSFDRWRGELPRPATATDRPFTVSVVGGLDNGSGRGRVSLWLQFSDPPPAVEWFPEAGERIKVTDPQIRTRGNLTRIDFSAAAIGAGHGPVDDLRSLVVTTSAEGERRGWEIDVPLTKPS